MEQVVADSQSNNNTKLITVNNKKDGSHHTSSDFQNKFNSIPTQRGLKMSCLNIVSLTNKFDEVEYLLSDQLLDIMALNETRLDETITDNMIDVDGYDIVRKDRNRNGGGVCFYLRSSINYKVRNDLIPNELEAVCIEITKPNSQPFIVITVYRPPNTSQDFFNHFEKLIQSVDNGLKEIIILGDLNCDLKKEHFDTPTKNLSHHMKYINFLN